MNANPNQQIRVNGVQYRLQYRKCGKPGCKCSTGEGHGPYWYSYDGQSAAKYVGAKLPEAVVKHREVLKTSHAQIKKIRNDLERQRDNLYQQQRRVESQIAGLRALEAGERVAAGILVELGLAKLNGHAG